MALVVHFTPSSFTSGEYDEVVSRLEAVGAGSPAGRLYHIAMETGGQIRLIDIWESAETFHAFGATLVPILAELGVDPGEPEVLPIHNIIVG